MTDEWIKKITHMYTHTHTHTHYEILFSLNKEGNPAIYIFMDEHYAKWNMLSALC